MPRSMLLSVRVTSASRPARTPAAYSSAPRRTSADSSSAMAMIRRLSASAASVSPRSSMRNAACSWARATIRSASSWAFSMIRSPSELMRLAARTSSGTATRSSSIRLRAASRSMIAFFVRGSGLPFAISDSRRSTRKMMSSGRPPCARRPGGARVDYGTRCGGPTRAPAPRGARRRPRRAASTRRRRRTARSPSRGSS